MTAAFSVTTDVPNNGHYQITLVQTGPRSASLDVREWNIGSDPDGDPDSDNSYTLNNIKVNGNIVTCTTNAFFLTPVLTFTLSAMPLLPSITVAISHALFKNSVTTYPISADDHQQFVQFLADADFPNSY